MYMQGIKARNLAVYNKFCEIVLKWTNEKTAKQLKFTQIEA